MSNKMVFVVHGANALFRPSGNRAEDRRHSYARVAKDVRRGVVNARSYEVSPFATPMVTRLPPSA